MIELDCKNEFYRVRSYHRYDKDGNALTKEISEDNETHPQPENQSYIRTFVIKDKYAIDSYDKFI